MSGAYSRSKGNRWEQQLVGWLISKGIQAVTSRNNRGGTQAGADVICDLPVSVEAKNHKSLALASWLDQAIQDADDCPASVWIKRRGKANPGEAYVVMRADQFVELVTGECVDQQVPL